MQHLPLNHTGVLAALGAALLFGAATPFAKYLLESVNPWMLAGLFYLGSGVGLTIYRKVVQAPSVQLPRKDRLWFACAIMAGGIVAPVLLMIGLNGMPASDASLLLNIEGVFTALLAWFALKENFDRRIALGMLAIVAGAVILSWPDEARITEVWPSVAILGACFAWGIDNNLTRKVSLVDASWIASVKGLISGTVNLVLALSLGAQFPALPALTEALVIGFLSYGTSLVLFVIGLRHLGTARTGAYFSVAPLFGTLLAVLMGEPLTLQLLNAGLLMSLGVWLHFSEHHEHSHSHEQLAHSHEHAHEQHHNHAHEDGSPIAGRYSHWHVHDPLTHTHPHYPDTHHRHRH